ncbi:hypothetical protein CJ430_30325, partial [Klebsiella pneumoniae]
ARESYLRGVEIKRGENERAIAEHSQKMGWLLLKTWIWMLVSIVLFLSATSGILWYQGELIAERQATLQLGREGRQAKADPVREEIGAPLRADLRPNPTVWG